jgi:tetratricopeptide (TPR) repeat protein
VVGLIACAGVLAVTPVNAERQARDTERLSKDWKQTSAGDIQVLGPVSEGDLRGALQEIRIFREVFSGLLPHLKVTSPNPTRVYVFSDAPALRRFAPRDSRGRPQQNIRGYFASTADVNIIAVGGTDRALIYHEFAHYLLSRNLHSLPMWLSEGLAEFYSTFTIDQAKGEGIIGRTPSERLRMLRSGQFRYVPIKQVIEPSSEDMARLRKFPEGMGMFYAESWALVHYLLLGREPKIPGAFGRMVAAIENGTGTTQAIQTAFKVDLPGLENELKAYLRRPGYSAVALDVKTSAAAPPPVQPMREADARYLQGDLLVRAGAVDQAATELQAALAIDPAHTDARVTAARLLLQQQKRDEAIRSLQEIATSASANFSAAYYLAAALAGDWRHDEAQTMYSRAAELKPESIEAWMGLSVAAMALGRTAQADSAMAQVLQRTSDPDMYRTRALAALAVGADAIAAADTRRYLEISGWSDETAIYAAFVGAIAHLRLRQSDEARDLLTSARTASASLPWALQVTDFLDARLSPADFLAKAKSDGEKTEAHAYIAFRAEIEGRKDEAVTHFQWVVDRGVPAYYEYGMARGALKRLQR